MSGTAKRMDKEELRVTQKEDFENDTLAMTTYMSKAQEDYQLERRQKNNKLKLDGKSTQKIDSSNDNNSDDNNDNDKKKKKKKKKHKNKKVQQANEKINSEQHTHKKKKKSVVKQKLKSILQQIKTLLQSSSMMKILAI
ncbi:hypothetical protein RFI_33709 [Reticulomyxa filosa]|uniref:Uncharacterized protein n=1 Tax=Reticulomyxa filosa TaxID=46433 RepID=X6LP31_RETFI|nr:hypothetical protein RFI_33709 [Reticulomyxa filosa]|eukprot:ETO03693.1 hypothetical protein RFI_33709 [Reticulomyxa filosa]